MKHITPYLSLLSVRNDIMFCSAYFRSLSSCAKFVALASHESASASAALALVSGLGSNILYINGRAPGNIAYKFKLSMLVT